jgi:hypothetical protein
MKLTYMNTDAAASISANSKRLRAAFLGDGVGSGDVTGDLRGLRKTNSRLCNLPAKAAKPSAKIKPPLYWVARATAESRHYLNRARFPRAGGFGQINAAMQRADSGLSPLREGLVRATLAAWGSMAVE